MHIKLRRPSLVAIWGLQMWPSGWTISIWSKVTARPVWSHLCKKPFMVLARLIYAVCSVTTLLMLEGAPADANVTMGKINNCPCLFSCGSHLMELPARTSQESSHSLSTTYNSDWKLAFCRVGKLNYSRGFFCTGYKAAQHKIVSETFLDKWVAPVVFITVYTIL